MEMQTNSFLNRLGFREYLVKKDRQLFEDPLRNGTLLCKLVEALNQSISLIIYNPRNIHDCRANIENALSSLRAICTETSIPLFLLHKGEDILKGDHDTIWSLLYTLMKNENTIKSSKHVQYFIIYYHSFLKLYRIRQSNQKEYLRLLILIVKMRAIEISISRPIII